MTSTSTRAHGTRAKYAIDRCRCIPCTTANRDYANRRNRRKVMQAYDAAPPTFVDAAPARQHVRALMAAGMGWKRIAAESGTPQSTLSKLLYGKPGLPPPRCVRPETASKLLALTMAHVADGTPIDATGTRRRLQALIAIGWSGVELANRIGWTRSNFQTLLHGQRVTAGTARTVIDLYEQLWDATPLADTPRRRMATSRARAIAAARGWPPPMAWDDDTIDNPAAQPDTGERTARGGIDLDEVNYLTAGGCSIDEIARRMGVTVGAIERARYRAAAAER